MEKKIQVPEPVKQAIKMVALLDKYIEEKEKGSQIARAVDSTVSLFTNPMFYIMALIIIIITSAISYRIGRQRAIDDLSKLLEKYGKR